MPTTPSGPTQEPPAPAAARVPLAIHDDVLSEAYGAVAQPTAPDWSALPPGERDRYAAFGTAVVVQLLRHGQPPVLESQLSADQETAVARAAAKARPGVPISDVIARATLFDLLAMLIVHGEKARMPSPVDTLALDAAIIAALSGREPSLMTEARGDDVSWGRIGAALRIDRTAAFRRHERAIGKGATGK